MATLKRIRGVIHKTLRKFQHVRAHGKEGTATVLAKYMLDVEIDRNTESWRLRKDSWIVVLDGFQSAKPPDPKRRSLLLPHFLPDLYPTVRPSHFLPGFLKKKIINYNNVVTLNSVKMQLVTGGSTKHLQRDVRTVKNDRHRWQRAERSAASESKV